MKLIGTATSVEEAIANEQAGMDMVIAQGSEAGGHGDHLHMLQVIKYLWLVQCHWCHKL